MKKTAQEDSPILLKPVGWLKTEFKQKFGTPRQGSLATHSRATVELARTHKGRGILSGLEGFSHVWLITHLHLSQTTRQRGKIHPPRLRGGKVGILASRSPHRPNNLGLTLAKILKVEKDTLYLSEVDLVDGTPILDIKPYLAAADRPEEFSSGWTDQAEELHRPTEFTESALADMNELEKSGCITEPKRLRALIQQMLELDPRPPAYLERKDSQFAVWVAGVNVTFRFHDEKFTVTAVQPAPLS
jgi:tRNA (adenine37-N6)-methyltransferase